MRAAIWPRDDVRETRLLRIDPARERWEDGRVGDLRAWLRPGDVLVVNDAATLPASLRGTARGEPVELRLAGEERDGRWRAVLFGAGDWRTRTEDRPPPPRLVVGDVIALDGLDATVVFVDDEAPRLIAVELAQRGAALWRALYRAGTPVQYSYLRAPLSLWHVQTAYATRPWAAEAPSAGFSLTWDLLLDLRRAGVTVARVTHAAGLSSTGDAALDARLPLAERYAIPDETVAAIEARKGRVIAVGTTVTRALEGAFAAHGKLVAGEGVTDLVLGPTTRRRVVGGILTGVHEVATSHFRLLESFAPRALLEQAHAAAAASGYLGHEFGDAVAVV